MENYSKYFINSTLEFEELMALLLSLMGGERQRRVIQCKKYSLTVIKNKDHDEQKVNLDPTNFLYYPYYLELEAEADLDFEVFLGIARELFLGLMDSTISATVACDFEELLPLNGRYVP